MANAGKAENRPVMAVWYEVDPSLRGYQWIAVLHHAGGMYLALPFAWEKPMPVAFAGHRLDTSGAMRLPP